MSKVFANAKKDIERIASAIRIRDAFAAPDAISYIPTDPAQLLFDKRKLRMLSYFWGADVEKLSDYERFSEFARRLEAIQGSAEKEIFVEEMKMLYSDEIIEHIDDPRALWNSICEKMSLEKCNYKNKIVEISRYDKMENIRIFAIIDDFDNYSDFVSYQVNNIKKSDAKYVTADISVLNFARTDEFHAAEAYKKYKAGDRDLLDVALSGALYHAMSAIKASGKTLLLNIEDNFTSAEQMIEYFKSRDLMPNTVIFSRFAARRVSEQLCGVYDTPKGEAFIGAGLLYYDGDTVRDVKNRLLDICAAYPIDKVIVGGAATSSPLVRARHALLRQGIAQGLYELCEDVDQCILKAKNI